MTLLPVLLPLLPEAKAPFGRCCWHQREWQHCLLAVVVAAQRQQHQQLQQMAHRSFQRLHLLLLPLTCPCCLAAARAAPASESPAAAAAAGLVGTWKQLHQLQLGLQQGARQHHHPLLRPRLLPACPQLTVLQ